MKLSDRLTRAGLAFLIFGTCTALLPGNSGNFMTASDACTTGQSHHSNNTGKTLAYVGGGLAGAAAIIYFTDPALFAQIFGHGGGSGIGSGGPVGAFDPVTQLFQFIYDPTGSPAP